MPLPPRILRAVTAITKGIAFVPFVVAINLIPVAAIQKFGPKFLTEKEPKRGWKGRGGRGSLN